MKYVTKFRLNQKVKVKKRSHTELLPTRGIIRGIKLVLDEAAYNKSTEEDISAFITIYYDVWGKNRTSWVSEDGLKAIEPK